MGAIVTFGGEQQEHRDDGVNEPLTLASAGLLPWSDIKVTETPGGLSPEPEQQRRIQRLREIAKQEKFVAPPLDVDISKQLCDKCRMVPWDQLTTAQLPGPAGVRVLFEIHETREMLLNSHCLVCKFLGSIWPEGVFLDRCFLGMRCLCNMLSEQATSRHHSPGYDHSPQFQLSGHGKNTQLWSSENFGILHPWSRHDELAPRRIDTDRINIELIRGWLEMCKNSHKHEFSGPRGKENVPGFKVIDCQTKRVVPVAHDICRYVALSYVWGKKSEEQQIGQYPKTIEDAIAVCKMLEYEYLWVDRYCIDQNNKEEQSIQINMMDCIYSQADLTIVATDEGPTKGLPGAGSRPRKKQQYCDLGCVELIKTYHTDEAISRSTWATRGWTFQEGYLSRRKLFITENEAVYLCDNMYCQESIRRDIPTRQTEQGQGLAGEALSGISPRSTNERKGRVEIDDLLNEYNSRDLSYDSDALNACQGILRGLSIPHNWGHAIMPLSWWDKDRRPQGPWTLNLYWESDEPGIRREEFPSWSWVGWKSSKTFANYDHYFADAATIEVKSTTGEWLGLERCFNRKDGILVTALSQRIRITGLVVQLAPYVVNETWIKDHMPGYHATHKGPHVVLPYSQNVDIVATVHLDKKDTDADILKDAVGLLINQHRKRRYRGIMLLLKPNGDHYHRVGTLHCRNLGVFKNQRDFTQSKRILKEEDGCFWLKDFTQKAVEVE